MKNISQGQIRLVTMDFDGTSLQRDQTWLSYRNMHAIQECRKRGIMFVPCSGRTQDMFPPQIEKDMEFRYWITTCASRIVDRLTGEVIYGATFTPGESADLCRLYEGRSIYSEVAADGKLYFEAPVLRELWKYPVPPHHVWYLEAGRAIGVEGRLSDFFLSENIGIEKVNLYGTTAEEGARIRSELRKRPFVEYVDGTSPDIQFFSTHVDRLGGVSVLLERLGLGWENVMHIGDQMGMDSAMFSKVGLGVAMGNAKDDVKALADDVTDTFDRDGFGKALEKWLLY